MAKNWVETLGTHMTFQEIVDKAMAIGKPYDPVRDTRMSVAVMSASDTRETLKALQSFAPQRHELRFMDHNQSLKPAQHAAVQLVIAEMRRPGFTGTAQDAVDNATRRHEASELVKAGDWGTKTEDRRKPETVMAQRDAIAAIGELAPSKEVVRAISTSRKFNPETRAAAKAILEKMPTVGHNVQRAADAVMTRFEAGLGEKQKSQLAEQLVPGGLAKTTSPDQALQVIKQQGLTQQELRTVANSEVFKPEQRVAAQAVLDEIKHSVDRKDVPSAVDSVIQNGNIKHADPIVERLSKERAFIEAIGEAGVKNRMLEKMATNKGGKFDPALSSAASRVLEGRREIPRRIGPDRGEKHALYALDASMSSAQRLEVSKELAPQGFVNAKTEREALDAIKQGGMSKSDLQVATKGLIFNEVQVRAAEQVSQEMSRPGFKGTPESAAAGIISRADSELHKERNTIVAIGNLNLTKEQVASIASNPEIFGKSLTNGAQRVQEYAEQSTTVRQAALKALRTYDVEKGIDKFDRDNGAAIGEKAQEGKARGDASVQASKTSGDPSKASDTSAARREQADRGRDMDRD